MATLTEDLRKVENTTITLHDKLGGRVDELQRAVQEHTYRQVRRFDDKILQREHHHQQHNDRMHEETRYMIEAKLKEQEARWDSRLAQVQQDATTKATKLRKDSQEATAQARAATVAATAAAQTTTRAAAAASQDGRGSGGTRPPLGMGEGRPGGPPPNTLLTAGFDRDTPAEHIDTITRAWLCAFPFARDARARPRTERHQRQHLPTAYQLPPSQAHGHESARRISCEHKAQKVAQLARCLTIIHDVMLCASFETY